MSDTDLMTTAEVANHLKISAETVRDWWREVASRPPLLAQGPAVPPGRGRHRARGHAPPREGHRQRPPAPRAGGRVGGGDPVSTHRTTWKRAEAQHRRADWGAAAGAVGSAGRGDATRSDTTHARLFVEVKRRDRQTARTLFDATKALARKEGKVPILALVDKGRPGFLVVIHADDLAEVAAELARGGESPPPKSCRR